MSGWETFKIDPLNKPIDWTQIIEDAKVRAKESFGRPDVWTEDAHRAWDQLRQTLKENKND